MRAHDAGRPSSRQADAAGGVCRTQSDRARRQTGLPPTRSLGQPVRGRKGRRMKTRGKGGAEREIIIKRRGKKGHDDAHGGAWMVAFADFTLAMMALFMVLWIVQPRMELSNPSYGEQESNPLVDGGAGIFDGTSTSPLELDRSE